MKPKLIIVSIAIAAMVTSAMAEEPDSVYIMPFAETHNTGRSGMKLKWSSDGENWEMLCDGRTVIRSDWGSWKTMINPCIERIAASFFHPNSVSATPTAWTSKANGMQNYT